MEASTNDEEEVDITQSNNRCDYVPKRRLAFRCSFKADFPKEGVINKAVSLSFYCSYDEKLSGIFVPPFFTIHLGRQTYSSIRGIRFAII